ncbi:DEAD-box ATP-dependent RNA helicase 22 [Tanacetum coccineum]
MLMSRLLQSFLQQAPNELTREGKLSNVLGIFNKLVCSRLKNSPSEKQLDMESVLENNEDIEVDSIVEDDEESEDETYVGKTLEEAEHVIGKKRDRTYISVAATLPKNRKRTTGGELKWCF